MTVREQILADPEGRKAYKKCFTCGMCVGGCPVARVEVYNQVENLYKAIHNLGINPSIWLCATCYKCEETCPKGVKMTYLVYLLKRLYLQENPLPPSIKIQTENIRAFSYSSEMEEMINKKRKKMGLPPMEVTKEVAAVLEACDRKGAGL